MTVRHLPATCAGPDICLPGRFARWMEGRYSQSSSRKTRRGRNRRLCHQPPFAAGLTAQTGRHEPTSTELFPPEGFKLTLSRSSPAPTGHRNSSEPRTQGGPPAPRRRPQPVRSAGREPRCSPPGPAGFPPSPGRNGLHYVRCGLASSYLRFEADPQKALQPATTPKTLDGPGPHTPPRPEPGPTGQERCAGGATGPCGRWGRGWAGRRSSAP